MRYHDEETLSLHITHLLSAIAPGFSLDHYHAIPLHDHTHTTVCATEGLNRLMFDMTIHEHGAYAGRFGYIGTKPCTAHQRGLDPRVSLLAQSHPVAHIQHVDNEEDENQLFGYVAYDDEFRPLAWAPVPVNAGGWATPDAEAAYITHTLPDGLAELTACLR